MIFMPRRYGLIYAGVVAAGSLLFLASTAARAQDPLENAPLAPGSDAKADPAGKDASASTSKADGKPVAKSKPEFIRKTPAEWRKLLTKVEFAVTRGKSTESPFTGRYASGHFKGTFVCVCCDAAQVESELFSSQTKFESGTGWPSFYQPFNNTALQTAADYSEADPRVEVMCRRCGAHLGHVFDDGPPPTGLRFCVNSAAIKLKSSETESTPRVATGKSKSKSKSKAKAKPKSGSKAAPNATEPGDSANSPKAVPAPPADDKKDSPPATSS
jgi:peptide-methionine (R)-S-oxide reductase